MRSRTAGIALLLFLLLLAGCGGLRYNQIVGAFDNTDLLPPGAECVSGQFTSLKTGDPVEGARITVLSKKEPLVLVSDVNGIVTLPIRDDLRRENPRMKVDKPFGGKVRIQFGVTGRWTLDKAVSVVHVGAQGKERSEREGFSVWYSPGQEESDAIAAERLSHGRRVIAAVTGFEPVDFGVVIIPKVEDGRRYVVDTLAFGMTSFAVGADEVDSPRFLSVNVHEWTERTLGQRLDLHSYDARNRFITDGIAQYAAFVALGYYHCNFPKLETALADCGSSVNLLEQFHRIRMDRLSELDQVLKEQGFPPGYDLSFVFWYQLCQRHGEDLTVRFLAEMKGLSKRDADSAIRVLERLTDENDIRYRLENADVLDAIEVIKRLQAPPEADETSSQESRYECH